MPPFSSIPERRLSTDIQTLRQDHLEPHITLKTEEDRCITKQFSLPQIPTLQGIPNFAKSRTPFPKSLKPLSQTPSDISIPSVPSSVLQQHQQRPKVNRASWMTAKLANELQNADVMETKMSMLKKKFTLKLPDSPKCVDAPFSSTCKPIKIKPLG